MSTCRSCGAEIVWLAMKSGAAMPADPKPLQLLVSTGRTATDRDGHQVPEFEARKGFQSHFASCKFADQHRKGA